MSHLETQHWKFQFTSTRKSAKGRACLCSVKDHYTSAEAAPGLYVSISGLFCSLHLYFWFNTHFSLASELTSWPFMPSKDKQGRRGPAALYQTSISGSVQSLREILAAWNGTAEWEEDGSPRYYHRTSLSLVVSLKDVAHPLFSRSFDTESFVQLPKDSGISSCGARTQIGSQ